MPTHRVHTPGPTTLDFAAVREELGVPGEHGPEAVAEAEALAASGPIEADRTDATHLALVTIDPPGSTDLDQALAIEPIGSGWRVRYAIADVAAWIGPEGSVAAEAWERTQTYYAPDHRAALHPPALSEAAASLLPDGPRPAVLWTIDVDQHGATADVQVERALVRSRAQLTYEGVQAAIEAGHAPDAVVALPHLGAALLDDARRRGAIELGLPEQEVDEAPDGTWHLALRAELPVERWNAQVSLLTGRAAAWLMLEGGIGLLRTLPSAAPETVDRLRAAAANLGIAWPPGTHPGEVLAATDVATATGAAFADLAAELLRGAAYTVVRGRALPDPGHAGVGAPYAHVTAPLRRLVDRFATEACLALAAGRHVPGWVDEALDALPEQMAVGDRRARALDRAVVDATEAFVLQHRVGEVFTAQVVEVDEKGGTVVLADPPVRARCTGPDLPLGGEVRVRCTDADVARRTVRFEVVP